MGMNPDTNRFEPLQESEEYRRLMKDLAEKFQAQRLPGTFPIEGLIRPDGSPVPKHWSVFEVDEEIVIKGYTFKVAYIGATAILFEPVGIPVIGGEST